MTTPDNSSSAPAFPVISSDWKIAPQFEANFAFRLSKGGNVIFHTDKQPCWFHRAMQRVFLGIHWTNEKERDRRAGEGRK